jgi:hypothetical protein
MPTSNSKPMPSYATDKPLGAPGGNEPYKTIRAKNWAQDDGQDVAASNNIYDTNRMGNIAQSETAKAQPKPSQEA